MYTTECGLRTGCNGIRAFHGEMQKQRIWREQTDFKYWDSFISRECRGLEGSIRTCRGLLLPRFDV